MMAKCTPFLVGALALAILAAQVAALCPVGCSGHGACLPGDICDCNEGWAGDDCSISVTTLTSAVPKTGQTVNTQQWKYYMIDVPTSSTLHITVNQTSVGGDTDVYVQKGTYPTKALGTYLVRDISSLKVVTLNIQNAQGKYYIGLWGFATATSTINATIQSLCLNGCSGHGECLPSGDCRCDADYMGTSCNIYVTTLSEEVAVTREITRGRFQYYKVDFEVDNYHEHEHEDLIVTIEPSPEDAVIVADLYIKFGELPRTSYFDYRKTGATEAYKIAITEPMEGDYYLGVLGTGSGTYKITLRYSEQMCPNLCSGPSHGTCDEITYECECNEKYSGHYCNTRIPPLAYGEVVRGYVADNAWNYYTFNSYSSANALIRVHQEDNVVEDCDVYVARARTPTFSDFEYRDISWNQNFTVLVMSDGVASTWMVGVHGYDSCNYTLSVELSRVCPGDCSGKGQCMDGTCVCDSGFTGSDCSQSVAVLTNGMNYTGTVLTGQWRYYEFTAVAETTMIVTVHETRSRGLIFTYANPDHAGIPTLSTHLFENTVTYSSHHNLYVVPDAPRKYIIAVFGNALGALGHESSFEIAAFQARL